MGVTQNIKRDNIFISIKKKLFDCEYSCAAIPGQREHGDRIIHEILTGLVAGWTGCTFDAVENDFTTGICFLVGLNKLNCILGVNPLYYSYGIADYFWRLLANFELCFNKESNILETIIVIFD